VRAVVGLGANQGDRLATMRAALDALRVAARVVRVSPVYETAPVGPPQPDFLNAAALLELGGEPVALLELLLATERSLGRVRTEKWGPRTIDLDVLWIEGIALVSPRLTVPHPHLTERAFALVPLLDVEPSAIDPRSGAPFEAPTHEGIRRTALVL
jgi:2-amino-4-hydroxy-6-hydroxymethyldihydropteridine diphosphokinase